MYAVTGKASPPQQQPTFTVRSKTPKSDGEEKFQDCSETQPPITAKELLTACGFTMGTDGNGNPIIAHKPQLGAGADVSLTMESGLNSEDLGVIMQALNKLPEDNQRSKIMAGVLKAINNSINPSAPPPKQTPFDKSRQFAAETARVLAANNLDPEPIWAIPEYIHQHHPLVVDSHSFDSHQGHTSSHSDIPLICKEWEQVPANCPPSKHPLYYSDATCRFYGRGTPNAAAYDSIPGYCTDGTLPRVDPHQIHNLYTAYESQARASVPLYLQQANAMVVQGEQLADEAKFFGEGAAFKNNPVCLKWDQLPKFCPMRPAHPEINPNGEALPDYLQGVLCKVSRDTGVDKSKFVRLYDAMPWQCEKSAFNDFSYPQCRGYLAQVAGTNDWPQDLQYAYCQWQADLDVSVQHAFCSQWNQIPNCGSSNSIKPSPWTDGQCLELFETGQMGNVEWVPLYSTPPSYCSDKSLRPMTVRICEHMIKGTPMENAFPEPRGAKFYGHCIELAQTQGIQAPSSSYIPPIPQAPPAKHIPLICQRWQDIPANCNVYANIPQYAKDGICLTSVTGDFTPKYDAMPSWCLDGTLPRVTQLDVDLKYAPQAGVSREIPDYLRQIYTMLEKAEKMAESPRQSILLQHEICSRWQGIPKCPYNQHTPSSPWNDGQCMYQNYMGELGSNPPSAYTQPPWYCNEPSLKALTAEDCDKMLETAPIKSALEEKTRQLVREQILKQLQTGKKSTVHPHILQYAHCLDKNLPKTEAASTPPQQLKPPSELEMCSKQLWKDLPSNCQMVDTNGQSPAPVEFYTDAWCKSELARGNVLTSEELKYPEGTEPIYCKLKAPSPTAMEKVRNIPWVAERESYFQQAAAIRFEEVESSRDINRPSETQNEAQAQAQSQLDETVDVGVNSKIWAVAGAVMNLATFTSTVVNDRRAIRQCNGWAVANLGGQVSLLMSSMAALGGAFGAFPITAVTRAVMALNATSSSVVSATSIRQLVQLAKDMWHLRQQSPDLADAGRYVQGNIEAEKGISSARQVMKLTGSAGQLALTVASIMGALTPAAATCTLMALYGTTWFGLAMDALKGRDIYLGDPLKQEGFTRTDADLALFGLVADSFTQNEIGLFPPLVAETRTISGRMGRQALTDEQEISVFEKIFDVGVNHSLWTKDQATKAKIDLASIYEYCELDDWCTGSLILQNLLSSIAKYRYQDKAFCDDDRGFGQNHVHQHVIMYFMNALACREQVDFSNKSHDSVPLVDLHKPDDGDEWFDAKEYQHHDDNDCGCVGACNCSDTTSVTSDDGSVDTVVTLKGDKAAGKDIYMV